jgi:hypothetical protein
VEQTLLQYGIAGVLILMLSYTVKELWSYSKDMASKVEVLNGKYQELLLLTIKTIQQNTEAQGVQQQFDTLLKKLDEGKDRVSKTP